MHLNWSRTMRYSPAHAKAWNVTLSDIKAQFDSKQGVFSKANMSQPADVQRSMLENYVGKLLEKNFSESVNEELSKKQAEALDKRQKAEETFKTRAKEKFKSGAEKARMDQISPTELAKEGATTFDVLSQRIDKELKRQDYDELSTPVKILDSMIPTPPDIVEGTISTFKNLGSAIIGNTPTAYITGLKNKQLQDNMEAQLQRPLTKSELAGKNELVNEMARTMIKSETDSTIGKMLDWVLNAGEPSERQAKIDRLTYELKYQSLEGIKRGMESVKTPTPKPKPPEDTVPPEVSSAQAPIDSSQQAQVAPDALEPSLIQKVMTAAAPIADAVLGGSPVSAEPRKFTELPEPIQKLPEQFKYVSPESAAKSIQRNNPFNVENSRDKWLGKVKSDSKRFMATDTPLHGLRAGYINFLAKLKRGETVAQMIETISPKSDKNPTSSMVKVASSMADVNPDETLEVSMDNFDEIKQLGLGLLRFEAPGHNYPDSLIDEAVKLAIEQKAGKSKKVLNYPPPKNFKQEKELKPIVEKKGNLFDSIGDAMRSGLTEAVPDNLRFFASYLHDEYRGLQGRSTKKPVITENQLSAGVQSVLKTAALKAHAEGRDYVTYTDYPDSSVGLSIPAIVASKGAKNKEEYAEAKKRYPKGWKGKARLLLDSTDDAIAAATTIGQFSFKIENGELVLLDTYDFSKYGGAKNSAYAEVRKSVETKKDGVAYQIKANLGKFA